MMLAARRGVFFGLVDTLPVYLSLRRHPRLLHLSAEVIECVIQAKTGKEGVDAIDLWG